MGASGLMASFKYGPTQPLQVAWGVRSGIEAALLAGQGNAGYHRIIDEGFFPAYLGSDAAENLRTPLEMPHAVTGCYLKPWPGCRHLHASLDAFDRIAAGCELRPERIERIDVGTYRMAIDTGINTLDRRGDAYFNIPYAIAARAVLGRIDYDAFDERHFASPAIRSTMGKVSVTVAPEIEAEYPLRRGSRVIVTLAEGGVLTHRVEYALGEPENPLAPEVTAAKLRETAAAFLSKEDINCLETILDAQGNPGVSPEQVRRSGLAFFLTP
jgi:2-methylcitrate dehydratase PrpD